MQELYTAAYVARHLGVTKRIVHGWVEKPTAAFPMPIAVSVSATRSYGFLWTKEQLAELRLWLARRLDLPEPDDYWHEVDAGNAPKVPQGQFEIAL